MLSPARGAAGSASTKARRPAVGTIDQRGSAASEEQPVISGAAPPAVIKIEQRGIEFVPLDHRWGKPAGLFWMWAGAVWNVEFVLYGALAVIVFGLSFAQALLRLCRCVIGGESRPACSGCGPERSGMSSSCCTGPSRSSYSGCHSPRLS